MFKRTLLFILILLLILTGVVLFNTFRFTSESSTAVEVKVPELANHSLENFQKAISFRTISFGDSSLFDSAQFLGFQRFLINTYPEFHKAAELEIIKDYSLLYRWQGKDSQIKPVVIMAHQDVVPIEEATKTMWTVDPFGGVVKENFIWGRGTTDDKINLVAIMEAAEKLAKDGFQPGRTVYFAFGHDEEIGGKGAKATARLLKERGIAAEFVLDEGGIITTDKVPGVDKPVALLGTAEKGYLSLKLFVEAQGGHSSMPQKETAIDILSKALVNLRSQPFDADLSEPMRDFMNRLGPQMPLVQRMVFANPWLFKKLILNTYEQSNTGDAMIRTTIVPTIIEAGIKDNVVPTVATAVVNFRLLPGHTSAEVLEGVKKKISDERVAITILSTIAEASQVTSIKSFGYKKIETSIQKTYPEVVTSPFLMVGATDSRHFNEVSTNIIKFSPMVDPIGFHGIDERVSLESYRTALWFYEQLLRDLN